MKLSTLLIVSLHILEVTGFQDSLYNYKYKFNFHTVISKKEAQLKLASGSNNSNVSYEMVSKKGRSQFQYNEKRLSEDHQPTAEDNYWLCEFPNMKIDTLSKTKKMKKDDLIKLKSNALGKISESIQSMDNPIMRRINSEGKLVYKHNGKKSGKCLYKHTSYWTYEICYDGEIEQFHALENQKTKKLLVDPTVDTFLLGNFNGKEVSKLEIAFEDETGNYQLVDPEEEIVSDGLDEFNFGNSMINRWSVVQTMSNGQNCDLTNEPRKITFKYSCFSLENANLLSYLEKKIQNLVKEVHYTQKELLSKTWDSSVKDNDKFFSKIYTHTDEVIHKKDFEPTLIDIKEWKTCNYEILVHFPKLCEIPEFIAKNNYARETLDRNKNTRNSNDVSIECMAIVSDNNNNNNTDSDGNRERKSIENFYIDINEYKLFDLGLGHFYGICEENIANLEKINLTVKNFENMESKPDILIFNDFDMTIEDIEKMEFIGNLNFLGFANVNILEFIDNLRDSGEDPFYLFTTETLLQTFENDGGHYCLKIYNKLGEYLNTIVLHAKAKKAWYEVSKNIDCEKNYYSDNEYKTMESFKETFETFEEEGQKESEPDNSGLDDEPVNSMIQKDTQMATNANQEVIKTITNTVTQTSFVRDEL